MLEATTRGGAGASRSDSIVPPWSAQQTNLGRAVIDPSHHLATPLPTDAAPGQRYVNPPTAAEWERLRSAWTADPISCIRAMNEAIGLLDDSARRRRYLVAALELEISMDRDLHRSEPGRDLAGLPGYLPDGYTDFEVPTSAGSWGRRERIVVDKEGLRAELLSAKSDAVDAMSRASSPNLETSLRETAAQLRNELDYHEIEEECDGEADDTLRLSERIARGCVSRRHLAILYQLRLQEAGFQSTMTKGALRLFSLKVRHTWNVVREGRFVALVDIGFAEETSPLVLVGNSLDELQEKAVLHHRWYRASPDSGHRYQIRHHDCGDATSTVL